MNRETLNFALEQLQASDWKLFEEFASEFLVSDFPNLRSVASALGDRGRDSELFSPRGEPSVLLQYSVTTHWEQKLRETGKRIGEEFPAATILIYVTNQQIGAEGDNLRQLFRKRHHSLILDIRDRGWFLDRRSSTNQTLRASESLISQLVDPLLVSRGIIQSKFTGFSDVEARAALIHLKLQWEDDTRNKGLTKICFEALVRSTLRETDSSNRVTRKEVHERVGHILGSYPADKVGAYTDAALKRLNKKSIRHYRQSDEFCLTHHERLRFLDRLVETEKSDRDLNEALRELTARCSSKLGVKLTNSNANEIVSRIKRIIERIMLSRGELFVTAVKTGRIVLDTGHVQEVVIQDLGEHPDLQNIGPALVALVRESTEHLLARPDETIQRYLRSLSDAYTLMAFLKETPDVQAAISKMFSEGTIWIDANIVLPLLAETLLDEPGARKFQTIFQASVDFGLKLRVTAGVIEEVERHTNKCITFARSQYSTWQGPVPFLVNMYSSSGRSLSSFGAWLEIFRGDRRPLVDLAEYLNENYSIEVDDFDISSFDEELRIVTQEIFFEAKSRGQRVESGEIEPMALHRLVMHDTENYVGVITKRKQEKNSPLGYTSWWLTLDRSAFMVERELRDRLMLSPPDSPVLSPDFLTNYLAFGPRRGRLPKASEARLPISLGTGVADYMPAELIVLAEQVRQEMKDLPEHVVRRRVRDELDSAKQRRGSFASGGLLQVEKDLIQSLAAERILREDQSAGE